MKEVKSQSTDLRIRGIDLNFYALRHGSLKNTNVDKDKASLTKNRNVHETNHIICYRPENKRNRLEFLRPETWYH